MKHLALLAGGYSREREAALESGYHIFNIFEGDDEYRPYLIDIGPEGWFYHEPNSDRKCEVNKHDFSITLGSGEKIRFDLAMLLMGGAPGEDGQMQGYLELVKIPYVGCGILASAITLNKTIATRLVRSFNSPIVHVSPSIEMNQSNPNAIPDLSSLRFPLIVKPSDTGSSLGVTKVNQASELPAALSTAFKESKQVLIEQFITGREITVGAVRLDGQIRVLPISEIIHPDEGGFFDVQVKFYGSSGLRVVTPADLTEETRRRVEAGITELYEKLDLKGLVRIDMMLEKPDEKIFFLEVNASPSQTSYSILSRQLAHAGWSEYNTLREFYKQVIRSTC